MRRRGSIHRPLCNGVRPVCPRIFPGEIHEILSACVCGKDAEQFVFTRENNRRVRDFRKEWAKACSRAGCPDLLFHDLRRTGARNLRRLGVSEGVIMKIGGWRTRSVFDRYNIVHESDLADAARRLDEKRTAMDMETKQETDTPAEQPTSAPPRSSEKAASRGHALVGKGGAASLCRQELP